MSKSKAVPVQIAFRSNPARYSFAGSARLINAYAEKQGDDAAGPLAVLPCPGWVSACSVTDTPNRGAIFCDDLDCAYVVHSSGVFKVTLATLEPFALSASRIGTLPGTDMVQMSRNQADPAQISIHSENGEFYIEADIVKKVVDTDIANETVVTQDNLGGYTLYGTLSGKFIFSGINDCADADGLDFATAEQSADRLTRIKRSGQDAIFFGKQSVEFRRLTADADNPFELIGGATKDIGWVAPLGVCDCDNTVMGVAEDDNIYRFNGYSPQIISTPAQSRYLQADPDRESVLALGWQFQGHQFASFIGSDWSQTYDASTQVFHDRVSYNLETWRARSVFRGWGKTIFGDSLTGNLYYADKDTFTEGDDPLIWGFDTPIMHAAGGNGGIVDALHFDVATGVGASYASTADGYDPIMMLSWSVDGGKTYKGNRQLKLGKLGQSVKVRTRRIGRFADKGIIFRVRISDPVIRAIVSMSAKVRPLQLL